MQNSLELIIVVALFTMLFTAVLHLFDKISNSTIRFVLIFLIFIIPFISFFIHFLQQLGLKSALISFGELAHAHRAFAVIIIAFCGMLFLLLAIRYSLKMTYAIIMVLLTLSPLNLLAGWTLWTTRHENTKITINAPDHYEKKAKTPDHNIIIILFDLELSYEYLYKDGLIKPQYANFQQFASLSDNYHNAISPGNHTLTAIPGILNGRHYENIVMQYDRMYNITKDNEKKYLTAEPDSVFALAKEKGYTTFAYGPYLPYCEIFGQYLDVCRTWSIYNFAAVEPKFSLLNPIITNFMLWPRQKPQGFIKNMAISRWQRMQIEQVMSMSLKTLDESGPIFLFSHIYIPHNPFVFNRNGYYDNPEPILGNDDNYQRQLEYVDYVLGALIQRMKKNGSFESSEVIVLSDHNFRIRYKGMQQYHIPLIIKKPYQRIKRDIYDTTHAEYVVRKGIV